MTAVYSWICLILLLIVADTNGKTPDVQVTCMFSEDCVLPCVFEAVGDEIIYWFRQNVPIHSSKQGSGQIYQPDQGYRGRTSLFTEMISSGNASLHIQKCGQQDRGKYRCLVTSSRETTEHFIIVKVEAFIQSVSLETTRLSGFEEVICSCRDIYPAPRVNLFIEPAGLPDSLQPFTRKTADKQGLYSVESKLKKLNNLTYICLVQSFYRSQTWRASLQEKEIFSVEGQDFIIPCVAPWNLQNFTLTWSFTKEHKSSTIYTYDSLTQQSSSIWKEKVRLVTPRGRGGDGSLQLHNPLRLEHTGTYTCILSAHQTKHEVHTRVNITQTKHEDHRRVNLTQIKHEDHRRVNITQTKHEDHRRVNITQTKHEDHRRVNITQTKHEDHRRVNITQTKHEDHRRVNITQTKHEDHRRVNITQTKHEDHRRVNITQTKHEDHRRVNITQTKHEDLTRVNITQTKHEDLTRVNITQTKHEDLTRVNITQTKHEDHRRVNITQTKHEDHRRVNITQTKHEDHRRVNITQTKHEDHRRVNITQTKHEDHRRVNITQTKHEDLTRVNITQTKHEDHRRVNITQTKHEDNTTVNITRTPEKQQAERSPQWWIPAAVITGVAVTAVAAFIGIIKCKGGCTKSSKPHVEATEMQPIRVTVANSGAASEDTCLTEDIANRPT